MTRAYKQEKVVNLQPVPFKSGTQAVPVPQVVIPAPTIPTPATSEPAPGVQATTLEQTTTPNSIPTNRTSGKVKKGQ